MDKRTCLVDWCYEPVRTRQLCHRHYQYWLRNGIPVDQLPKPLKKCSEDDCERRAHCRGLCEMHYARLKNNGHTRLRPRACVDHADGSRSCSRCGKRQPIERYERDDRQPRGRRAMCRSCREDGRRARHAADPERYRAVARAWREANPEKITQYHQTAYETWREEIIERNSDLVQRRRALKRSLPRDRGITPRSLRKRDGDRCAYCGVVMSFAPSRRGDVLDPTRATVDHVIPLTRIEIPDGGHTWANCVLACARCNTSKNDRTPEEWRGPAWRDPQSGPFTTRSSTPA